MWSELWDLVLPRRCGGCGAVDTRWCRECEQLLEQATPTPWNSTWAPTGCPPIVVSAEYAGALAQALRAYKDDGRGDLATPLAAALVGSLRAALLQALAAGGPPVGLTVVPSSAAAGRRRGTAPVARLATGAVRIAGWPPVLRPTVLRVGAVRDQAGLGRAQRAGNIRGAMRVPARARPVVRDRAWVVIDDIVTTGATLSEAARALRTAGARTVVGAAVAATPRIAGERGVPRPGRVTRVRS